MTIWRIVTFDFLRHTNTLTNLLTYLLTCDTIRHYLNVLVMVFCIASFIIYCSYIKAEYLIASLLVFEIATI